MEFPPINDERAARYSSMIGSYSDERLRQYSQEVRGFAESISATYITTWDELAGGTPEVDTYLAADGVHQNTLGHEKLYQLTSFAVDAALQGIMASYKSTA